MCCRKTLCGFASGLSLIFLFVWMMFFCSHWGGGGWFERMEKPHYFNESRSIESSPKIYVQHSKTEDLLLLHCLGLWQASQSANWPSPNCGDYLTLLILLGCKVVNPNPWLVRKFGVRCSPRSDLFQVSEIWAFSLVYIAVPLNNPLRNSPPTTTSLVDPASSFQMIYTN